MTQSILRSSVAKGAFGALAALGLAGCPSGVGQLCPPGTKSVGSFSVALNFQTGHPDECRVTSDTDGGPLDASIATTPAPQNGAVCIGPDGGQVIVTLAVDEAGGVAQNSGVLGDGGTFTFNGVPTVVPNTACICTPQLIETITGRLLPASPDGGISWDPDAGLSPISGFTGLVTDALDGGPDCHCNVPCTLYFGLVGTKQ